MAGPMPEEVCVKRKEANSKNQVTARTTMLKDQIQIRASQLSSAHRRQDCAISTPAVSPDFFDDCVQYKSMCSVCWQLVSVRPACAPC